MANKLFYRDMVSLLVKKICQQSNDGRLKEIMAEVGLSEADIHLFCDLQQMHIEQLAKSRISLFKVEMNTEAVGFIKKEVERIKLIERCISYGATNAFLGYFFGLTSRDAYSKRICAAIDAKRIRRVASIFEADLIVEQYLMLSDGDTKTLDAQDYCDLYLNLKNMGHECSLKAIWVVMTDYLQIELPSATVTEKSTEEVL